MKRNTFIMLFIGMHLIFVFAYIHKQSAIIELSFAKQRYEKQREILIAQKNSLMQQLERAQRRSTIKQFAVNTLKFKPITLHQIEKLNNE